MNPLIEDPFAAARYRDDRQRKRQSLIYLLAIMLIVGIFSATVLITGLIPDPVKAHVAGPPVKAIADVANSNSALKGAKPCAG